MEYRQALAAGTLLAGEYRIAATLRQDGFCITYDAEDVQLKSHVLIKEYFPSEVAERVRTATIRPKSTRHVNVLSAGRQRFIEEAQTLTKFSHPGIARVKRVFEENNSAYAVIDAGDWPTLLSWVDKQNRPLSQNELEQIAKQLLDSLEVLHEAGVLVRDLSPESIFIRDKRQLVLVDFGTAKSQFAARARKMHAVVRPGYSAPEQYLFDDTEQGPWTDIFSLAAVLYRLTTGRGPVDVIHRHHADEMAKAVSVAPKSIRAPFAQAIDRGLALDIKARPQSIKAFRALLLAGAEKPSTTAQPKPTQSPPPPGSPAPAAQAAADGRAAPAEMANGSMQAAPPTSAPRSDAGAAARSSPQQSTPKAPSEPRPASQSSGQPAAQTTAPKPAEAPARRAEPRIPPGAVPSGLLSERAAEEDRLGFTALDNLPAPEPEPPPAAPAFSTAADDKKTKDATATDGAAPDDPPVRSNRTLHSEVEAMAASNRRFMMAVVGIIVGLMTIIGGGLLLLERTLRQSTPVAQSDQKRIIEDAERRRAETLRQQAEAQRLAEESRVAEQVRLAAEAEARRKSEAERQRLAEEKRQAEEKRAADQKQAAEEARRAAEQKRLADEAAKAEAARLADQKRQAEEAERRRIAEEKRLADEAERKRLFEDKRRADEKRAAEEAAKAARLAEEKRQAEEAERRRLAEQKRLADEKRAAEEAAKAAEAARIAEQKRQAEEAERNRIAVEKRQAEEASRLAEQRRVQAEQALLAQIAAETSRDNLLRLAVQNAAQRPAIERRLTDLGFMRVPAGAGETWIRPGSGEAFRDCPGCPLMVVVPPGQFLMGSPAGETGRYDDEDDTPGPGGAPVRVTIPKPFAIGRFEVTRGQFAAFVSETAYKTDGGCYKRVDQYRLFEELSWRDPDFPQDDEHPVACMSWLDAKAYTEWLARKTGRSYRLLTEAEWEYAARGAPKPVAQPRFPFGDGEQNICAFGNGADASAGLRNPQWRVAPCNDAFAFTSPVGSFEPNAIGLQDMLGNQWEWVEDCYHDSYRGQPAPTRASGAAWNSGCSEDRRVLRGGSWSDPPGNLRPAARDGIPADKRIQIGGFRVARAIEP